VDNLRREHGIVVGIVGQVMEHMVVEVPEELVKGTHVLYGGGREVYGGGGAGKDAPVALTPIFALCSVESSYSSNENGFKGREGVRVTPVSL